jgi:hypothetical protein
MTKLLVRLFDQLGGLPRGTDEYSLEKLMSNWLQEADVVSIREAIYQWLSDAAAVDYLKASARETATHYVWPLRIIGNGYGLALNEFKDPRQMMFGYADTIHNHRYSFVSLVLSGGYRQIRSTVEVPKPGTAAQVCDIGQDDIFEGSILAINHEEFHRLIDVKHRTMTLLVKCPAVKEASISVDAETLRASRHVPVEARLVQLMNALVMTRDAAVTEGKSDARLA